MHLIVYEPVKADIEAFVKFWSGRYIGCDDDFYADNVGQELTEARIAMRFIEADVIEEVPTKDADKIRVYADYYLPFHARFNGLPQRAVDKALWAFGKFIGENNFPGRPLP